MSFYVNLRANRLLYKKELEQGADIDAMKTGIKAAFDSTGYGGQQTDILFVTGILSDEE